MIFIPLLVLEEGNGNEEFLNPTNRWMPRRNRESIYPAILRVCRRFLIEGRVLLYSKNSFHFDNPRDVIGFSYVQQRSLNTRLVTSLHLSFRVGHMQDIHDLLLLLECGHFKKDFPCAAQKTLDIEFIGTIDDASFTMIDEALRRGNLRAKKVWIIGAGKRGGLLMDALSEEPASLTRSPLAGGTWSRWA